MDIYIGTILFEPHRWGEHRDAPAFVVSAWQGRLAEAGFDGMELWANHVLAAEPQEPLRIKAGPLDVAIFNSYASLLDDGARERHQAVQAVTDLSAPAVKYNFSNDPASLAEELDTLRDWQAKMPDGTRMLCECHPGTQADEPAKAARVFEDLDPATFGAMLHPFNNTPEQLDAWFDALDSRIQHMHTQHRGPDDAWQAISEYADHAVAVIDRCKARGFAGSWTVEFTRGVHPPEEDLEELYRHALADLAFLRDRGI